MISLGIDLVAGKKRVPIPATGKIALVTLWRIAQINAHQTNHFVNPSQTLKIPNQKSRIKRSLTSTNYPGNKNRTPVDFCKRLQSLED